MLLALVPAGGHIVTTTDCYRRTRQFIQTVLPKMGISATVIEPSDLAGLERVRRDLASLRVEYQKPIADPEYHRTRFCLKREHTFAAGLFGRVSTTTSSSCSLAG